jgi:uncharacterized protein
MRDAGVALLAIPGFRGEESGMPVTVNIRKLEGAPISLEGEIPLEELEFVSNDEMVACSQPMRYGLEAELLDDAILVRGEILLPLDCECVRCLQSFQDEVRLADFAVHLPLEGEDAVPIKNDCVDLTPFLREDTFLRLPQHPLCRPDCDKLPELKTGRVSPAGAKSASNGAAAWNELDKLKLD